MSGPFPGMDPYLEDPASWQGHHNALIAYLWSAILAVLPEQYDAAMEDRCYIDNHEVFLNIYRHGDRGRIITAIELLSPTNKAAYTEGWRQYRQKQRHILQSRTHFVEIDLLRGGTHTIAVAPEALLSEGRWDYIVCLHRGGDPDSVEVRPRTIQERLPRFSVPLASGDPDLVLDLQAVLDRFYEEGHFLRRINYQQDPIPPLRSEDSAWADALLREKGLRS